MPDVYKNLLDGCVHSFAAFGFLEARRQEPLQSELTERLLALPLISS
jgi:hypothetical protein